MCRSLEVSQRLLPKGYISSEKPGSLIECCWKPTLQSYDLLPAHLSLQKADLSFSQLQAVPGSGVDDVTAARQMISDPPPTPHRL